MKGRWTMLDIKDDDELLECGDCGWLGYPANLRLDEDGREICPICGSTDIYELEDEE